MWNSKTDRSGLLNGLVDELEKTAQKDHIQDDGSPTLAKAIARMKLGPDATEDEVAGLAWQLTPLTPINHETAIKRLEDGAVKVPEKREDTRLLELAGITI